ncbi:hypothetical protein JDV02_004120 [Purpureocillium takamizusanense]|uniref:FAD dependent oxidoreductase domain-containing protein n=1 Tax=Purpureocillium takamizusanense TaxID=2060973 RepID=A0A9Q8QEJ8_9HYPO|nr:uncharacterized protein JDV02_004120 [Purpureocillium takamizusanense]UNI17802.1 hypothetical protein JDV02_004120 [Purpureocillium takamizusanense]
MNVSKSDAVIIVGGGAFGLSTALHLSRAGFDNVTVLEKDTQIPPRSSAGNDLNKIVRAEYEDPFYTDLTIKAIAAWKTSLFAPHFHQTGFLHCVSGAAPDKARDTLDRFQESAECNSAMRSHVVRLDSKAAIAEHVWQLQDGALPGWRGYLNRFGGYAHSADALVAVHREAACRGVRFFLGPDGDVADILYGDGPTGRVAVGVRTASGRVHKARLVVVAAGASVARLIPELAPRVVAKAWSVAHVQLTDGEASALRGMPVTYARDLGFFFEPDPKTKMLKFCPMGAGYVNTDKANGVSLPPRSLEESGFMPADDEANVHMLIEQTFPWLRDRPLVNKAMCWIADTSDSDYTIDYVPKTGSSVIVMTGDSGHGFKMFPIVGSWVMDLLEAGGEQPVAQWRWKNAVRDGDSGDWGASVSWRLGETREFRDVQPSRPKL